MVTGSTRDLHGVGGAAVAFGVPGLVRVLAEGPASTGGVGRAKVAVLPAEGEVRLRYARLLDQPIESLPLDAEQATVARQPHGRERAGLDPRAHGPVADLDVRSGLPQGQQAR